MPSFKCTDLGMQCPFQATAASKDEILLKIGMHAGQVHKMDSVTPEFVQSVQKAIK